METGNIRPMMMITNLTMTQTSRINRTAILKMVGKEKGRENLPRDMTKVIMDRIRAKDGETTIKALGMVQSLDLDWTTSLKRTSESRAAYLFQPALYIELEIPQFFLLR